MHYHIHPTAAVPDIKLQWRTPTPLTYYGRQQGPRLTYEIISSLPYTFHIRTARQQITVIDFRRQHPSIMHHYLQRRLNIYHMVHSRVQYPLLV